MSTSLQQPLLQWVQQLNLQNEMNVQEIESGRLVGKIMKVVVPDYNMQLLASNTAVNRVANWNNLITELKKLNIRVSQDEKNKIINGNHEVVYQIIARLQDFHAKSQKQTEVDISKINPKNEIAESSSLLQLFILAITKYFNLTPKESVALLSSECKYLAHILVKGLKSEFKPVEAMLVELNKNIELINSFCKNKENEVFFIRALKPSLISKSEVAAEKGICLLNNFLAPLVNKYQILKQYFVSTLILAIRRHPHLIDDIMQFTIQNSNFSKDLLTMFQAEATQTELQKIFISIFEISRSQSRLSDFFSLKGISQIIDQAVESIKSAESINSSMDMLITLSLENTDVLSDPERGSHFVQAIQMVNLSKKTDSISFIQQLFSILQIYGRDKNQLAPAILKILVSKYQGCLNVEESRIYIQNFKQILSQFPTIPFAIIVEAVNSRVESNTLAISEVEIQFFRDTVKNGALDIKSGLIVFNIVSKLLVEEPAFAPVCTDLIISIKRKLSTQPILLELCTKLVKVCLAMYFANIKRLSSKRRSVTGNSKADPEDILYRSKNLSLEDFIYRLVEESFKELNANLEPLICYSLIQVQQVSKDQAGGLKRIVALFGGNPADIIKKYEVEAIKLEQEENRKDEKKLKLKQSSMGSPLIKNRYDQPDSKEKINNTITSSDEALRNKMKSKLDPMSISNVGLTIGVTPAAIRGLEKYQKTYLHRVQRIQQEEAKKKEEEDRQSELKKIFQRKMLEKGIQVKKISEEQFKYIYDFGVKEKELAMDSTKNSIEIQLYHPDHEEERDIKGLEYEMRKYQKILKLYYNIYSGHNKPQTLDSFDKIAQKISLLYSASLWRLLKDHVLEEFITVKQVQYLCKKINHNLDKKFDDPTALDFEGFENFITQASIFMFTRPPKDLRGHPISEMIYETISRLKLYASDNKINEKLFEDPDNTFFNETEAVKELNRKLENNSDYILPEGYKKISEKKVVYTHRIFLDAMSTSFKDAYEVIDDIIFSGLGIHIIQPFTTYETIAKARPTLYYKHRAKGDINAEKLTGFMKREVAKMPIKDREVGKQVASVLDEIVEAVEFGHDRLGLKYENKAIKEKKMIQEEQARKQQEEKRKWENRNKQIKSALVRHKEEVETKQAQQQREKEEEKKRQQEDKKRKMEEEQRLKRKVENFQNKKKEDEERRKKQQMQQKKRQKDEMEKKKKQSEQVKRKIEESKRKKEEEENERKRIQEQAQKEKKLNEKRRTEEESRKKKEMIEQYKNKKQEGIYKSQITDTFENKSQAKSLENRSELKALDKKIDRKKLV